MLVGGRFSLPILYPRLALMQTRSSFFFPFTKAPTELMIPENFKLEMYLQRQTLPDWCEKVPLGSPFYKAGLGHIHWFVPVNLTGYHFGLCPGQHQTHGSCSQRGWDPTPAMGDCEVSGFG